MLVGMLKNSALYNPLRRPELVLGRRNVVLSQMVKYGHLDPEQSDSLQAQPLGLQFQRVSHDEGAAPYFRETLRAELKTMLAEKDDDGNYLLAKADGSAYDIYRDGLRVVTTIDSRMQSHAEKAVNRHLAGELQASFNRDLKDRPEEVAPFFEDIDPEVRQAIIDVAMRDADRYKKGVGKLCPSCNRPSYYISATTLPDGRKAYECNSGNGGCDYTWAARTDGEMRALFRKPVEMKVFTHKGTVDTVLSPLDSILHRKAILHAGLVSVEPATGHIKAWVGGIDFKHFKYDNVGQSRRQVGSTFKPFVYATALRLGAEPCDEFPNQKTCIDLPRGSDPPRWCPDNSDEDYGEMVTLEYALANSMNTVTAKLIKDYGTRRVIDLAHALGIESDIPNVPSIALGVSQLTLRELVSANASFVNQGVYVEPTFIARIEDRFGNSIYEPTQEIRQGLDERTAYRVIQMMKGVVNGAWNEEKGKKMGTGIRIRYDSEARDYDGIRVPMAGKTGTTQNNTDGWFMGLTPDLVTGVWVGAQDPTVRFSTTRLGQGANTGLPIYGYFMKDVYSDESLSISQEDFLRPESIGGDTLTCKEIVELRGPTFDPLDDSDLFN